MFANSCCRWSLVALALVMASCGAKRVPQDVSGTWTGLLGDDNMKKVGIRFELHEERSVLTGRTYFQDQGTDAYAIEAAVTGARDGATATWITESGAVVKGQFDGSTFTGTMQFAPDEGQADHAGKLVLSR